MAEDQGRQVASMLNEFGRRLTEVMGRGKEEASRMARAAQIGLEIMTLEGLHLELMVELGEAFYDASGKAGKGKAKAHQKLVALVARVREVEKKMASLKRAMKNPPSGEGGGKRRGRPPKASASAGASAGRKPGRRGRPPKASASAGASAGRKPARRGRPPKASASAGASAGRKPGRRGRPPRAGKAVKSPAKKAIRRGRPPKAPAKPVVAPAPPPEGPAA